MGELHIGLTVEECLEQAELNAVLAGSRSSQPPHSGFSLEAWKAEGLIHATLAGAYAQMAAVRFAMIPKEP